MTIYGGDELPFEIERDDLTLSIKKDEEITYFRQVGEESVEKGLLSEENEVVIHPVEPLNLPKQLTSALEIEFEKPMVIDPKTKKRIYLSFPIETAVFIGSESPDKPLDIFALSQPKYTLYGDVKTGTICKYWNSRVSSKPLDDIDPLYEGLLEMNIYNRTEEWREINRTVLNAYGMKIYFDEERVAMRGKMVIEEEDLSKTDFIDKPLSKGMKKAREVYRKKQPLRRTTFRMEGEM